MDALDATSNSGSPYSSSSPRSSKRRRLDEDVEMSEPRASSPSTELDSTMLASLEGEESSLSPMPASVLLLSLPSVLMHPPNHPLHTHSLCMSLLAIRRCLNMPDLSPVMECRAWTSLAELGMIAIDGGYTQQEQHVWAQGIEREVEEATTKGLMIAQKHPSLRIYRSQLNFLAAQLAIWQHNVKFALTLLRRHLTQFLPTDPAHVIYTAHLKIISCLIVPADAPSSPSKVDVHSNSSPKKMPSDVRPAIKAIQAMQAYAEKCGHTGVVLLTRVLRLRHLVSSGLWEQVSDALAEAEDALGIESPSDNDAVSEQQSAGLSPRKGLRLTDLNTVHLNAPSPTKLSTAKVSEAQDSPAPALTSRTTFKMFYTPFEKTMAIHTLIIGVVFYTYVGRTSDAAKKLSHLHALLDAGALRFDTKASNTTTASPRTADVSPAPIVVPPTTASTDPEFTVQQRHEMEEARLAACGIVQIPLSESTPPLFVQTTHPRILYVLAYLVSSVAKKDPVGRKPKRKIFAMEGLAAWERELKRSLHLPSWANVGDVENIDLKLAKMKADLMCELVGVSIMRSEFDIAEQTLAVLIAHLRSNELFESFSGRVSLHHAHLAHAKGQTDRAIQCYEVAETFATERGDDFVRISARAGRICMSIGLIREKEQIKRERLEEEEKRKKKANVKGKAKGKGRKREEAMDVDADVEMAEEPAGKTDNDADEWESMQKIAEEVAEACRGMGGTMWSVGRVIEACLTDEILKAKQHLKSALSFASSAGDNHLRALILALIASHYFHTATDDALGMLAMCENLAAGLGAAVKPAPGAKPSDSIGNAPLRTWVGERSLEIYKRTRNTSAAKKQESANRALQTVIRKAEKRPAQAMEQ